jgi:hypothetical protein
MSIKLVFLAFLDMSLGTSDALIFILETPHFRSVEYNIYSGNDSFESVQKRFLSEGESMMFHILNFKVIKVIYVRHTHRLQCHRFRPEDRSNPFQAILSY